MAGWSPLIWIVTDRWGREIHLDEDTWYHHIVPGHRTLRGHEAAVAKTLTNPYRVVHDAWHENRENFYRPRTHPLYPDLYVKVCVEFETDETGSLGTVITAYLTPNIGFDEVQRWP
jgi:hypothetical protein